MMADYSVDNETKWLVLGLAAIIFAIMMPPALSIMFGDKESDRIAACMTQPNMEYIDGDCRRVQPAE
jgi:membrane protein implicated in regulation of membrane protease activity